jgi:hypothetical protein
MVLAFWANTEKAIMKLKNTNTKIFLHIAALLSRKIQKLEILSTHEFPQLKLCVNYALDSVCSAGVAFFCRCLSDSASPQFPAPSRRYALAFSGKAFPFCQPSPVSPGNPQSPVQSFLAPYTFSPAE